ncbi:hypothetical protein PASE110613_12880 [Paenibacillus sediminis]|uniref:MFS family permease n=1 Tax=Paenibacillus sediminis TaxID=664909 RepID=A0ABS4H4X4_9BACL|nr:MFS family permease [Paenibacillus sediminis]
MKNLEKRKWWVLATLSFGLLAVGLDMTVLNVALPTLATDLHASTSELQWFANSYNLMLAAMLLPAGMLGDRFGRKKLLLIALILFGAASLVFRFSGDVDHYTSGTRIWCCLPDPTLHVGAPCIVLTTGTNESDDDLGDGKYAWHSSWTDCRRMAS